LPDEALASHKATIEQEAADAAIGVTNPGRFEADGGERQPPPLPAMVVVNARLAPLPDLNEDPTPNPEPAPNPDRRVGMPLTPDQEEAAMELRIMAKTKEGTMEHSFMDALPQHGQKRKRKQALLKYNEPVDELDLPLPKGIDERKLYNALLAMQRIAIAQLAQIKVMGPQMPWSYHFTTPAPLPELDIYAKKEEVMDDEEAYADSEVDDADLAAEDFNADEEDAKAEAKQAKYEEDADSDWEEQPKPKKSKSKGKQRAKCTARTGVRGGRCRNNAWRAGLCCQ
jgi:hypothetical protein